MIEVEVSPLEANPAVNLEYLRNRVLDLTDLTRDRLRASGFEDYRVGELLNPNTARHVRIAYASNEWTFHVGDLVKVGQKAEPVRVWSLDLRHYMSGKPLPSVADLIRVATE